MRVALVVGSSQFDDPELSAANHAQYDAEAVYEILVDPSIGYVKDDSPLLLNPTREELRTAVTELIQILADGDVFVLFLAGHAATLTSGEWVFLCRDTKSDSLALTAFPWSDLHGLLNRSPARGIVILDTCYSRSIMERKKRRGGRGVSEKVEFQPFASGTSILCTSGQDDMAFEGQHHGLLTEYLLRALRHGAALPNDRSHVTLADVASWIKRMLRRTNLSRRLWPRFRNSGNVAELYLALNINFGAEGAPTSEDPNEIEALTDELVKRLGLSDDSAGVQLDRLHDAADRCLTAGVAKEDETLLNAKLPESAIGIIAGALTVGAIIWGIIRWLAGEPPLWISIAILAVVVSMAIIQLSQSSTAIKDIATNPSGYFYLITRDGLFQSFGHSAGRNYISIPWRAVSHLSREQDLHDHYFVLTAQSRGGFSTEDICPKWFPTPRHLTRHGDKIVLRITEKDQASTLGIDFKRLRGALEKAYQESLSLPVDTRICELSRSGIKRCILVVGVGNYLFLPRLDAPAIDAQSIGELFSDPCAEVVECLDASLADFESALLVACKAASGGILTVYFSGHGVLDETELYLAFRDTCRMTLSTTSFRASKLLDVLSEQRPQHMILIFDCCYSGATGDALGLSNRSQELLEDLFAEEKENVSVLAASASRQVALEIGNHGLFTDALVNELKAQRLTGSVITLPSLYEAVSRAMAGSPFEQRCWRFGGLAGESIELLPRPASPLREGKLEAANFSLALVGKIKEDEEILAGMVDDMRRAIANNNSQPTFGRVFWIRRRIPVGLKKAVSGFIGSLLLLMGIAMMGDYGDEPFAGVAAIFLSLVAFLVILVDFDLGMIMSPAGIVKVGVKKQTAFGALSISSMFLEKGKKFAGGGPYMHTESYARLKLKLRNGKEVRLASLGDGWNEEIEEIYYWAMQYESEWRQRYRGLVETEVGKPK